MHSQQNIKSVPYLPSVWLWVYCAFDNWSFGWDFYCSNTIILNIFV